MKITLLALLLMFSTSSFAFDQYINGGCDGGSCGSASSYCNDCQCADPGYGRNTCMSNSEYCEAYGNVGAR